MRTPRREYLRKRDMVRAAFIVTLTMVPLAGLEAFGQRADQSITVAATIGGNSYEASGKGRCRHDPDASIDGEPASQWTVEFRTSKEGGVQQLKLKLRRLKDGGSDRLNFSLKTKGGTYRIKTGEGEDAGEGSVTILPNGPGRRLEINGKESGGKDIHVTIDCPRVEGIEPDGG
jgi:hypothetical protein